MQARRCHRFTHIALWLAGLALVVLPATGRSQQVPDPPIPAGPPTTLESDATPLGAYGGSASQTDPATTQAGLAPSDFVLPPPGTRTCLPSNPDLPASLLPDPLLPAPALTPQTYCDSPFGCEGPPAACPPPRWLVRGGAVFLSRSEAFAHPLVATPGVGQIGDGEQSLQLAADAFEFDMEAGPEIDLMFLSPQGWQAEFRHFDVATWESWIDQLSTNPPAVGRLLFDGQGRSALMSNPLLGYESELYSTEFNFRRPLTPWLTPMIGFRWVELQEAYAAAALERLALPVVGRLHGYVTSMSPTPPRLLLGVDRLQAVAYETHNHLYGLQYGADIRLLDRGGPLRINSTVKGGVYLSDLDLVATRQSFTIVPGPGGATIEEESFREVVDEETHVSFLGEITVGATWQVRKWLALRGGWQMLWLEGVALAPEQLGTTALGDPLIDGSPSAARVNTAGSPFYHGPYASIELVW